VYHVDDFLGLTGEGVEHVVSGDDADNFATLWGPNSYLYGAARSRPLLSRTCLPPDGSNLLCAQQSVWRLRPGFTR